MRYARGKKQTDWNTFIQICPKNADVEFKLVEKEEANVTENEI